MDVILLGTAAGGGFPQWNCWCPSCRVARAEPRRAIPRSQSSAAVSTDGRRWFLLNASPDVREQLARLPTAIPEGPRHVPVEGIVVTDAELDHTVGIMLLREARQLQLCATASVIRVLEEDSRILPVTRAFADVKVTTMVSRVRDLALLSGRRIQRFDRRGFCGAGRPTALCPGGYSGTHGGFDRPRSGDRRFLRLRARLR